MLVHTCSRLIQQQQLGLRRQRPGNLKPPLVTIRQVPCCCVRPWRNPDKSQEVMGLFLSQFLFLPALFVSYYSANGACLCPYMASCHDVFQGRHAGKKPDILECPRYPLLSNPARPEPCYALLSKGYGARCRRIYPGNTVEKCGLTCAVVAYQTHYLPLLNMKVHI